jgi:hypothetical protein
MTKKQWILSQSQLSGITNPNTLWSNLLDLVEIPNPSPQPKIPKPFDVREAFALVPDNEKLGISDSTTFREGILPAIAQGRFDWVHDNIATLVAGGVMSESTAELLAGLMSQTIPDPNWQSTVESPAYIAAGYDSLTLDEVVDAIGAT